MKSYNMFLMVSWKRQLLRITKCCLKKSKLGYQKELEKFTSE
jgi:hypothetical protein